VGPLKALDYIPPFSGSDDESFSVWYNDVCSIISTLNPRKTPQDIFDIALFNKLRGDAADIGRQVRASILKTHPPTGRVVLCKLDDKKPTDEKGKESEDVKEDPKHEPDVPFRSIFLEEFKNAYTSPAQSVKWFSKLENLRQNNSDVIKYVNLVVNISYRANQLASEQEIIVRIIRGLDDHYRLRISATSFKSIEDITAALTNIQSVDPPRSLSSPAADSLLIHSPPHSRGGYRPPRHGRPNRSRGNRSNFHRRPIYCHRCGVKGHIAPNCPDINRTQHVHQADDVDCGTKINTDFEYGYLVQFVFNKNCNNVT